MRHIDPTHEDQMDCLIRLALADGCVDEDVGVFDSLDISHVVFDKWYIRQRARIIRREKWGGTPHTVRHTLAHVAVFLLMILSIGTIAVVGVSGLIENWRKLVTWYEHSFSVSYEVPEVSETVTNGEMNENSTTTTAVVPPTRIVEYRKPAYVPDGMEERILKQRQAAYLVDYYINGEYICGYTQSVLSDREIKFGRDGVQIYDGKIHQHDAIWMEYDDGTICVIWNDGEYIFCIVCYDKEKRDDILKMAESVQ